MEKGLYTIVENRPIAENVMVLKLAGNTSAFSLPGQFVEIQIPGKFLRRPFSVGDWDENSFTVFYRISGLGTDTLSHLNPGEKLDVLTGLGNGFNLEKSGASPLLAAGGTGISPIYCLAGRFLRMGITPQVIMGFSGSDAVFLADELKSMGACVHIATDDGSCGHHGRVTDLVNGLDYSYIYACGPVEMLKTLSAAQTGSGQYSLEARMGCGFGACMGCSIMTRNGTRRVCKDGPVFSAEDLIW